MSLPPDEPKIDRRILRTRQALRDALFALIQEKEYDDITVEEITDRANLGRATFYLHYKDKEDLLLEEFSNLVYKRAQVLSEIPFSDWMPLVENTAAMQAAFEERKHLGPIRMIFEHIHENGAFYGLLLDNSKSGRILERIRKISVGGVERFMENLLEHGNIEVSKNVPVELIAAYFTGSILSTINWWMEDGMQRTPEEMADIFQTIFFGGMRDLISLKI
ncbi:TetR/AcrR family transcriptional regulator [bacterium]|nr:TetR/AcrR family transcriptional regulator [bacterium]